MKSVTIILSLGFITNTYSASAVYYNLETGKHYIVTHQASGDEAQPKALRHCVNATGDESKCKFMYKTDLGGFGAIAVGNNSRGYSHGLGNSKVADEWSMELCQQKSTPSSCKIIARWHDKGKLVRRLKSVETTTIYSVPNNQYKDCGWSYNKKKINCDTMMDEDGQY